MYVNAAAIIILLVHTLDILFSDIALAFSSHLYAITFRKIHNFCESLRLESSKNKAFEKTLFFR